MSRCLRAILLMLPLAGAAAAQNAPPQLFQFQSNFWINLHDLLYRHAQTPQCPQGQINGECGHYYDIAPADQEAWTNAVQWYAANLAKRSPLSDDEMIRIANTLSELAPDVNLDHRGLPDGLVDSLRTAAPVYRKYWWPDQDYWNQKWMEGVAPRLKKSGAQLAQQLTRIYGAPWPASAMKVDVVAFAGRTGAYTTLGPTHIFISSTDTRNQGETALEVLFHEASHGLMGKVWDALAREFRARHKPQPRDLWHVLLFYTTGELVARVIPDYVPYADRNGLYKSAEWARYHDLLERDWKPYLDGKTDFDSAIAKLAADY